MGIKVLGIDPGLHIIGYGIIEWTKSRQEKLIEGGVIRTAKATKIEYKLQIIHQGIKQIIEEHAPDSIAVEDLFSDYKNIIHAINALRLLDIVKFGNNLKMEMQI